MTRLTIAFAAEALRAGRTTSVELVEASLDAIHKHQAATNAFIGVDEGGAREAAAAADAARARGEDRGPLHGIPISLKDLIDVAGVVTTAGSRALRDRVPRRDATIVTRLREAGAIVVGRTNLHEFALGTTSEDSAFGPVKHPLEPGRSAGGSSGGSAAAVALGMGLASIGTDTGGSIRIPAAACGVVGLKPAYGEVPTDGVIPLSSSLDHAGPLTTSVKDAALVWSALTAQPWQPERRTTPLRLTRLIGRYDLLSPEVRTAFERSLDVLRRSGATIATATLDDGDRIPDIYVDIVLPEGAAWHGAMLDERADDYSPVVRARFLSARSIPAVRYIDAQSDRVKLRAAVDALLRTSDALVLPTMPIVAPPRGADEITIDPSMPDRTPVRSAMLRQTQPFNLTGHPAISIPAITDVSLPVGIQLVGRTTADLLNIALTCERILAAG